MKRNLPILLPLLLLGLFSCSQEENSEPRGHATTESEVTEAALSIEKEDGLWTVNDGDAYGADYSQFQLVSRPKLSAKVEGGRASEEWDVSVRIVPRNSKWNSAKDKDFSLPFYWDAADSLTVSGLSSGEEADFSSLFEKTDSEHSLGGDDGASDIERLRYVGRLWDVYVSAKGSRSERVLRDTVLLGMAIPKEDFKVNYGTWCPEGEAEAEIFEVECPQAFGGNDTITIPLGHSVAFRMGTGFEKKLGGSFWSLMTGETEAFGAAEIGRKITSDGGNRHYFRCQSPGCVYGPWDSFWNVVSWDGNFAGLFYATIGKEDSGEFVFSMRNGSSYEEVRQPWKTVYDKSGYLSISTSFPNMGSPTVPYCSLPVKVTISEESADDTYEVFYKTDGDWVSLGEVDGPGEYWFLVPPAANSGADIKVVGKTTGLSKTAEVRGYDDYTHQIWESSGKNVPEKKIYLNRHFGPTVVDGETLYEPDEIVPLSTEKVNKVVKGYKYSLFQGHVQGLDYVISTSDYEIVFVNGNKNYMEPFWITEEVGERFAFVVYIEYEYEGEDGGIYTDGLGYPFLFEVVDEKDYDRSGSY